MILLFNVTQSKLLFLLIFYDMVIVIYKIVLNTESRENLSHFLL